MTVVLNEIAANVQLNHYYVLAVKITVVLGMPL